MTERAGIGHWHAREGRHTAVSIMSHNGVPIQEISDTVGHKSTHVTETVYRHVIVPAISRDGRWAMGQHSFDRTIGIINRIVSRDNSLLPTHTAA